MSYERCPSLRFRGLAGRFYLSLLILCLTDPHAGSQDITAIKKKAANGDATAQYALGIDYSEGQGVQQDDKQAVFWWRKAAEQGNARAQENLGVAYAHEVGVSRDFAQAALWFRRAADQGDADAQNQLGFLYLIGWGVPQSYKDALFWLDLAGSGKLENLRREDLDKERADAASHLTQGVLSETEQRVRKWRESHHLKIIP